MSIERVERLMWILKFLPMIKKSGEQDISVAKGGRHSEKTYIGTSCLAVKPIEKKVSM